MKSFENCSTEKGVEVKVDEEEENLNEDNEEMLSSAGTFESRNVVIIPSNTP